MNPVIKRYLVSSITTFATTFLLTLSIEISSGAFDPTNIGWGIVLSVLGVAARAAVKSVVETFTPVNGDIPPAQQ